MNGKVAAVIAVVVVVLAGGYVFLSKTHSRPSVVTTLHVTVSPADQLSFVAERANSAMFKYMISKATGLPPALARQLEIKTVPASSLVEARLAVMTHDDAQRLTQTFVNTLQDLCGPQAQLKLAEKSVN